VDQSRFLQGLNVAFGAIAQAGGFATAVVACPSQSPKTTLRSPLCSLNPLQNKHLRDSDPGHLWNDSKNF
jgi:hypothetical protein